ncbi:MAG: translation elongation factor Ts [Solitalea-like symbiont of Acarus siro]
MSNISVSEINKLRQFTGLGLLDCKKALVEANGDFDEAVTMLRKKGLKIVAGKQLREASEGISFAKISEDEKFGVIIELACETDFVAQNELFIKLANSISDCAIKNRIDKIDALINSKLVESEVNVKDYIDEVSIKVGEKINLKNLFVLAGDKVVKYIHSNYRIAVLVALEGNISDDAVQAVKEVAMQVASMNPLALRREDVSKDIINKELEVAKEQARNEGKSEDHLDKIAEGRLNKFYKETVLLEQAFVKDNSKSVEQYLLGFKNLRIIKYIRSQIK